MLWFIICQNKIMVYVLFLKVTFCLQKYKKQEKYQASPLADSFSQFQTTKATKSTPQYT